MNIFAQIIHAALLAVTPVTMLVPTGGFGIAPLERVIRQPIRIPDLRTLSYDEVLELLEQIESGSLDDRYSMDELDQINQFIMTLAFEGAREEDKVEIVSEAASLFRKDDFQYALFRGFQGSEFIIAPNVLGRDNGELFLCKGWLAKCWESTKDFVKKHKTAIIVGAVVVVTVAVVVVAAVVISASAASAAAGAGIASIGGVAAAAPGGSESNAPAPTPPPSTESFTSSIVEQVTAFKETIAKEQFAAAPASGGISIEENGRLIGSLFSHKMVDTFNVAEHPSFAYELKDLGFNSQYPIAGWQKSYGENPTVAPHYATDLAFATDYTTSYATDLSNLNATTYQARGDLALRTECYDQAVHDFGQAISLSPNNPVLYLERGIANFELGNYGESMADYSQYIEKNGEPFSVTDFSLGFAKGVPQGVYESGKGIFFFVSEFVVNPVQTSKQLFDSLTQLVTLVKNDEFGVVAEALSPELHKLVTEWDTLPSHTRGELAGYAVGKLGADLLAPGAVAKVVSKSVKSARELVTICKNIELAQETLILETAAGIGMPVRVSEVVTSIKRTTDLGEDLGFSTKQMAELHKAGMLEKTVTNAACELGEEWKASHALFEKAEAFLEQYKDFMPESQIRELIHQTGVKTFPRPAGIPENFKVQLTSNGAGMKYVHPTNSHIQIRVMPGKPHSPNIHQQNPYVVYAKNGKAVDKLGNLVERKDPAAHIPISEFIYRDLNANKRRQRRYY
jgi:tetratricopeptide (TPR) repeat protein